MKYKALVYLTFFANILSAQTFIKVLDVQFAGTAGGDAAFADINGDGDQDVLITGSDGSEPLSILYSNGGAGNFTQVQGTPFTGVSSSSSVAFEDVDGDNDLDVLLTGSGQGSNSRVAALYTNDGEGMFTEVLDTPFQGVKKGTAVFSDINGDGDQDVLIAGDAGSFFDFAQLYSNDGMGVFTALPDTPFEGVSGSAAAFADVDADCDQDVLITGWTGSTRIAKLHLNDSEGNFSEAADTQFEGVNRSALAFADVDGDGDQDLLLCGLTNTADYTTRLYLNDGGGSFAEATAQSFEGIRDGSLAFADVDSDNDLDLFIAGRDNDDAPFSRLYTNDGAGQFSEVLDIPFEAVRSASVAFADVDADGDPDLLLAGINSEEERVTNLYLNTTMITSAATSAAMAMNSFTVFPNPATQRFTLQYQYLPERQSVAELSLYDTHGIMVLQQEVHKHNQMAVVNISHLPAGLYILRLQQNGQHLYAERLVVK